MIISAIRLSVNHNFVIQTSRQNFPITHARTEEPVQIARQGAIPLP
ncbi:hypothetical protein C8R32_10188 [Nitrosospira sp. Nsp5]|uniref:Uncharacterized protein n=1 Tax=Nitrosospira multiformis TaxID=1231 RepID=A0ABY0TLQ2_9PROT|nr:hypothetical protein C8R32_10188 [Nitrosospira sp. Nsp5]SDQ80850.1 hypothetical protein SAMN05216402_2374 [Nitrosospira multiformis]